MGHSARAKFKREIRQQRLVTVIETQKDKRKRVAIQLALERAAAQPKTTGSNLRSKSRSIHQNVDPVTRSETGIPRGAPETKTQETQLDAAKCSAPVLAPTKTQGQGANTARASVT
jgi:hypothetical protein